MSLLSWLKKPSNVLSEDQALSGRNEAMPVLDRHHVNGHPLKGPWPSHMLTAHFALGCFWGAERVFWQIPGVYSTAVGYSGGYTQNPTYQEVCSERTGHAEAVLVVYDPAVVSYRELLRAFWQAHDPTQGMRQGNDVGTQYRSVIFCANEDQRLEAQASLALYQDLLSAAGMGAITTEIVQAQPFYYAESYHQQYLSKNPSGYCGLGGTGVCLEA